MKGKGFLKEVGESNEEYLAAWVNDPWYPAIKDAHDLLSHFIPGYQITQIKHKFGDLRFYYVVPVDDLPHDERELYIKLANHIVLACEVHCATITRQEERERLRVKVEADVKLLVDEEE